MVDQYYDLAFFTYWFSTFFIFEIIISIFYNFNNGLHSRNTGRFSGTTVFLIAFGLIMTIWALSDRYLSDPVITLLIKLELTLIPLLLVTLFTNMLYAVTVMIGRGWGFRDVRIIVILLSVVSIITILMIHFVNKLI